MDGNFGNRLKLFGLFVCKKPVCRTRSFASIVCSCLQRCNDRFLLYGTKDPLEIWLFKLASIFNTEVSLKNHPVAHTVNRNFFGISIYQLGNLFRVRIQYRHHKLRNYGRCCRHFRNMFNNFSFLLFYFRIQRQNCYFATCDTVSCRNRRWCTELWRWRLSHWRS